MGGDIPAPLGHAVDFRLLDIVSGANENLTENVARKYGTLPAYTGKKYVCGLFVFFHIRLLTS